jgi:hypothetical protein
MACLVVGEQLRMIDIQRYAVALTKRAEQYIIVKDGPAFIVGFGAATGDGGHVPGIQLIGAE